MPKSKKNWVDFKTIKAKIKIEDVLIRYGLINELKQTGKNLVGCCPIHKGSNPRQFSANIERNIFNCFGNCKGGGNVIDFVAKMEKISIRDAALLLQEWFLTGDSENKATLDVITQKPLEEDAKLVRKEKEPPKKKVNLPLAFELKSIDPKHPFFKERGILPATVTYFGLGYCKKGIMKDRVAIPIHDNMAELVAYCGRAVTQEQIDQKGKYKLPANFHKSEVVYNLQQQPQDRKSLIVVESFISVWKLHQAEYFNAVALMGSVLSESQENLIVDVLGPSGCVILMLDADEDGRTCTQDCLARLSTKLFVKAVDIGEHGRKPHQVEPKNLKELLG